MLNELVNSGQVSTWLHVKTPLVVKEHLHYSAIQFKLIIIGAKCLYFNQRNGTFLVFKALKIKLHNVSFTCMLPETTFSYTLYPY